MPRELEKVGADNVRVRETREVVEEKTYPLKQLVAQRDKLQAKRDLDAQSFTKSLNRTDAEITRLTEIITDAKALGVVEEVPEPEER